ncbi:MAG: DUF4347 domain-containing protein [Cyanobacteria bacterium P01_C01_bin.89]
MQSSLFIVDSRISDVDQLLAGIDQPAQFLPIAPGENAIAQISQALGTYANGVDRLEILCHGQPGALLLGRDSLDAARLTQYGDALKTWGRVLGKTGEIILHGCQVGAGEIGRAFVEQLHRLTGVGIAANRGMTGGESTGGSWNFNVLAGGATGRSRLNSSARRAYSHTLTTFVVDQASDDGTGTVPGTLSWGILQANDIPGADTIEIRNGITFSGVMTRLINSEVKITGDNSTTSGIETQTISGGGFRPLFVKSGTVTLENLEVAGGTARGGSSGYGGGGAGMGGALFVYDGTVAIQNVAFSSNRAIGGAATGPYRGGGGLFGTPGSGSIEGGGGLFANAPTALGNYDGGYGGTYQYGGGPGLAAGPNYDGSFGGGGASVSGMGGNGGFGGGGGNSFDTGKGGNGGFGGGGGYGVDDASNGGYGGGGSGFGGFGTGPGMGGFGGADGNAFLGGAGAGFGGAVFVRSGSVSLDTVTFNSNVARRGNGGSNPNLADGRGGAIFIVQNTTATLPGVAGLPATLPTVQARNVTFSGSDAASAGGTAGVDGVGANQNNDDVYGTITALPPLNANAPILTGLATQVTYTDNVLATGAQRLDTDVVVSDADSTDFDGGSLTVSYGTGGSVEDQLGVENIGTGTGEIGVSSGSIVFYEGTAIATIDAANNGTNGSSLSFNLNSAATPVAVEALIESLTYGNSNLGNPTASRTLNITLNDGLNTSTESIEVVVNNTLPDISVFGGGINFDGQTIPFALDSAAFGQTFERSLRVGNRGDDTLTIGGVSVPEGFSLTRTNGTEIISGPISEILQPGQFLDLTLSRTDLQVTSFTGELSFLSNDPDRSTFVIPLTGTITFEAQAPLEINFTLTRLTLPPVEFTPGSVQLEPGEIVLSPGNLSETIIGGNGLDASFGLGGNDNLAGGNGRDLLNGNGGDDQIDGGAGNDRIFGGAGNDRILAGSGDDIVRGNSGNDQIDGGDDNDILLGDSGNDFVDGGAGDDFIRGGTGSDSMGGGLDSDFILGEAGDDLLAGEEGNDQLFGGDGGDSLDGGLDNDLLNGGADNDILFGNAGNDSLVGEDGADLLEGGVGLDTLTGGLGADTFAVDIDSAVTGTSEFDVITDFEDGTDLMAIAGLAPVDTLTWRDGTSGLEVLVNSNQIFQVTGINSSAISPNDFVT